MIDSGQVSPCQPDMRKGDRVAEWRRLRAQCFPNRYGHGVAHQSITSHAAGRTVPCLCACNFICQVLSSWIWTRLYGLGIVKARMDGMKMKKSTSHPSHDTKHNKIVERWAAWARKMAPCSRDLIGSRRAHYVFDVIIDVRVRSTSKRQRWMALCYCISVAWITMIYFSFFFFCLWLSAILIFAGKYS